MDPLSEIPEPDQNSTRHRRRSSVSASLPKSRRRSLLDSAEKAASAARTDRRKSRLGGTALADVMAREVPTASEQTSNLLSADQVSALYQQCIKLATENKITAKNTWALGLIDHLHDLVQPNDQEGSNTNFQRASITLGAGIEIYSKRVDSVHTAAYKVLSGLSRGRGMGGDDEEEDEEGEGTQEGDDGEPAKENSKAARRAAILRDVNPSSTLEASFDALNVKKFDLAFAVDPLFQRTSAQFDEGGARGLLLTNLSVYNGCEVLFDSQEVPTKAGRKEETRPPSHGHIDLEPFREAFAAAEHAAAGGAQICPAMDELYSMHGLPPEGHYTEEISNLLSNVPGRVDDESGSTLGDGLADLADEVPDLSDDDEPFQDAIDDFDDAGMIEDGDEVDDGSASSWMNADQLASQAQGSEAANEFNLEDGPESSSHTLLEQENQEESATGSNAVDWLISGVENLNLEGKAWAGASHWKYRSQDKENQQPGELAPKAKRTKKEKGGPIDFRNLPPVAEEAIRPANPKDITLKNWPAKANTLLPEDIHYKVSQLSELFLVPGIPFYELAISRHQRHARGSHPAGPGGSDEPDIEMDEDDGYGGDEMFGQDDGEGAVDGWGDINFDDAHDLISAPRKVAHIGINYARASKQVDVRALKHTLWQCIVEEHDKQQQSSSRDAGLSFHDILARLSSENVVGNLQDLSIHLCFICLLHLANENGLRVTGTSNLDQMQIWDVPSASIV